MASETSIAERFFPACRVTLRLDDLPSTVESVEARLARVAWPQWHLAAALRYQPNQRKL